MTRTRPEAVPDRPLTDAVDVLTFGCRLNSYESEVMRELAGQAGLERALIVNSCAVTSEAERQARQAIRRARRAQPDRPVIVTGCAAQVSGSRFAAMAEVDHVLGNGDKLKPARWQALAARMAASEGGSEGGALPGDVFAHTEADRPQLAEYRAGQRAAVQVQNGCDHRCTFCIIPYGRGHSRSVPAGDVIRQIRRLVDNGHREIVLTGVDLTAWGRDLESPNAPTQNSPTLGALVRQILAHVPDLPRLRLSSLDMPEADPELVELIETEPRLMPHLHLSLQAGDDMILKRMKRRHLRADATAFCADLKARRPDIVFGADLIAGFPTETDAMFDNTLRLIEDCDLTFVHVFPFSPRPDTPAARMPQLAGPLIRARARTLRQAARRALHRHLQRYRPGQPVAPLAETPTRGRLPDFTPVRFSPALESSRCGHILSARVSSADEHGLIVSADNGC